MSRCLLLETYQISHKRSFYTKISLLLLKYKIGLLSSSRYWRRHLSDIKYTETDGGLDLDPYSFWSPAYIAYSISSFRQPIRKLYISFKIIYVILFFIFHVVVQYSFCWCDISENTIPKH